MRLLAYVLAAVIAASPAAAQEWKTYRFSVYSFALAFPAKPKIDLTTYQASDGRVVEAYVYSVTQAASLLRMTVVDLNGALLEDTSAIEHAVRTLTQGNEVKLDAPHNVDTVHGRQLSIRRSDGSHSFAAVFYRNWLLYQIEGIALSNQGEADAIRFQQSLEFLQFPKFAEDELGSESNFVQKDGPKSILTAIPTLMDLVAHADAQYSRYRCQSAADR